MIIILGVLVAAAALLVVWFDRGSGRHPARAVRAGLALILALASIRALALGQVLFALLGALVVLLVLTGGAGWIGGRLASVPWRRSPDAGAMTEAEALTVLGLGPEAGPEDIRRAHLALIREAHPDAGGSTERAARINRARDVLLRRPR